MKLIIFITVCILLGVNAQFDHTDRTGATLSLTASGTAVNGISEFSASVNDQVVGAGCRCNVHQVSNVRINNGPFNSGSYFEVDLLNTANATLFYYFGSDETGYFNILEVFSGSASFIGSIGFCEPSASSCIFDYYCDFYPNDATLQLYVCSDGSDDTLQDSINFYTVGVTQYVANVQTIGASRSLTQNTAVVNTYAAENPGPSNFVHYYHNLQTTVAEAGASSRLFVEVTNWGGAASGSAYVCVSFTSLVSNTNSLSSVVFPGGDINGPNAIPNSVFGNDPSGCVTYCQQGTVSGSGSIVVASFDSCFSGSCGFPEDIWIGVRTPSSSTGSTYTVSLSFRSFTIPDLVEISSFPTAFDEDLTDENNCDGDLGDFSCEDYYEVTSRPNTGTGVPGPYLAVNVFAVHEGSVEVFLSDGHLAGDQSLCPDCDIFGFCDEVSTTAAVPDCWIVVQPCQWQNDEDWIITVEGLQQDEAGVAIEYGIRVDAGNWPVTSVTADEWQTGDPYFGELFPYHYQHYTVTFTDEDLYDDSYFEVNLYTFHEEDEVGFAWRYGAFADDGTCFGYDGYCTTTTDCSGDIAAENTGFCRFLFLPCPIEVNYNDYLNQDDGLKVSQLQPGTYYFAVWNQGGSSLYYSGVHYTVLFNLRRSTPIFDGVILSGSVFEFDYTPQYYFTVPNDPTLLNVKVVLSEVTNGDLTLYARCGALAGDCPCWTYDDFCTTDDIECSITLPACACPEGVYYFSVHNDFNDENGNGINPLLPASFTLTPFLEYYPIGEIIPIEVSRAVVTFSGVLSNIYYDVFPNPSFDAHFYCILTTNIDPKNDILHLQLSGLVTVPSEESQDGVLSLTVAKGGIAYSSTGCFPQQSCSLPVNNWPNSGQFGVCDLVFQPCYAPSFCATDDCELVPSFTSLPWDYTDTFFVTVTLEADEFEVQYTLTSQVIDQSPLSLANDQPFYGYVANDQYVHFKFDLPASKPDNALLYVNLYKNHDQFSGGLFLYIHHDASTAPTLAGDSDECLAHDLCGVCTISPMTNDEYCIYEISPCDLQSQSGSYYVSVRGFPANFLQIAGQRSTDFTLTVAIWEPVALLVEDVGIELPDKIYDAQELYYSVTVPTLSTGSIIGRVLTIEIGGTREGSIFFTIDFLQPFENCGCSVGAELSTGDLNEWRRYPCELNSGDVYYITVSGLQDDSCTPVQYFVHARIYDVTLTTITLTSNNSNIVGSYDTSSYTIGYNEWNALRFTTNAVAGAVLNIDITQPLPIGGSETKFIEARLSIGDIATRSGYNTDIGLNDDEVGPSPDSSSCIDAIAVCSGELRTTCSIFVDACAVPEGQTTWYLTFTGEDLTVDQVSDPVQISIRLISPQNVVPFPATSDYITTTTSTTVSTVVGSINNSYGKTYLTTSTNTNGINAGDTVTISYSGTGTINFFVNYADETGVLAGCPDICALTGSNPSCSFTACENIPSATWFIAIESGSSQSGTVSVRRTQTPTSTISPVGTISQLNTVTNFDALGPNQWRYHAINVPASTTSHYELLISGGASFNDVVYVGSTSSAAVWLPGLIFDPLNGVGEATIFADGSIDETCGGFFINDISGTCCYPQDTSVFAVTADAGGLSSYSLEIDFIQFSAGAVTNVNLPSTTTRTTLNGQVQWFSFTLPAGNHFWFELDVTSGSADIYLNKGNLAGSDAVNFNDDFGACWFNDGLLQQVCPQTVQAGDFCDGFIPADCYPCPASNDGSVFYFAVIPANGGNATYSLTVIGQTNVVTLNTGSNNNLLFPSTGSQNIRIVDDTVDSQDFAVYSHYVWDFNQSPFSIANFVPITDDPEVLDDFTYPHITFTISNVVQVGTSTSADDLVDFFINSGSKAGISDCYGGRDITNSGSILPCLENSNGAAFVNPTTGDITCTVLFCDLACGEEIYFSVGRAVQDVTAVSFAIGINQNYTAVSNEIDIVTVALTSSGFTQTYTNAQSLNEVVYFKFTGASIPNFLESSTQFLDLIISNIQGTDTVLDVRPFSGSICSSFSSSQELCGGVSSGSDDICYINFDPCSFTELFVDATAGNGFYIRVSRTSGSSLNWGFTLRGTVTTATAIDASETTATLDDENGYSYSAVKDIRDGQWHFYEFNIDNGDFGGYNSLDLDISNIFCNDNNFDLDVYVSWLEDSDGVIDVARPNRWPTRGCYVDTDVDESSFSIINWCNTWGGVYRVALYADYGLQVYPDPVLSVTYPAVYSIDFSITVNVVPTEIPLNCDNLVTGGDYLVVRPDASNRGTRLVFGLVSDDGSDSTLWVSKNANPYETSSNCAWGVPDNGIGEPFTTINGDYYCNTAGDACTIVIDICEYADDTWFIYIDAIEGSDHSLYVYNNRVYTPVVALATTGFSYSSAALVSGIDYQFYNFIVDDTRADFFFQFTIYSVACDDCVVSAFLLEGPHGYAAGNGANGLGNSQACSSCDYGDCPCFDQRCDTSGNGYCVLYSDDCTVPSQQLYIGVRAGDISGGDEPNCPYLIDVTSAAVAVSLVEEIEICTEVYCNDYYQLITSDGQTDFTATTVTVVVTNYDSSDAIAVYFNYDHVATPNCFSDASVCAAGDVCVYDLTCNIGSIYVGIESENCLRTSAACQGLTYSISYSYSDVTIGTASVGSTVQSTGIVQISSNSPFYADSAVQVTGPGAGCSVGCQTSFGAGSYYVIAPGASFSAFQISSLSSTFSTATFDADGILFFSVSVPAGVDGFTIEFQDFAAPAESFDYAYYWNTDFPLIPCDTCEASDNYLVGGSCVDDALSLQLTCAEQTTYYLTLVACDVDICAQSFRARVIFNQARTLIGTNHNGAYTQLIREATCDSSSGSYGFYTNANGPLHVTLRQLGPQGTSASVSLYSPDECAFGSPNGCSAIATTTGDQAACGVADGCNNYNCASGLFYVDVDLSSTIEGSGVELLVVNQYVDLTGSVSDVIFGQERHFYRASNVANALSFKLTVNSGPAVAFIVYDGCDGGDRGTFSETQICAFGDCYIWVPTFAKHSKSSTYYVNIFTNFPSDGAAEWLRNNNDRADTPTEYTLTLVSGAANCGAAPSGGFCSDASIAGVNVWADISIQSVWKFVDPVLKNQEAECLYDQLSDRCVYPTDECRYWLKIFSCLETFPQCDSNGFQLAPCVDVCNKVEEACGGFTEVSGFVFPFECCRDRYIDDGSASTCYNIPPPPPPPPDFNQNDTSVDSSYPPPFEVPVFPTIYATMPPASEFYTFSNFKDAEIEREVIIAQPQSGAASVSAFIALIVVVAALLI